MTFYKREGFISHMQLVKYMILENILVMTCKVQACFSDVFVAVSSASAERSFSCLGRIKSYLRSTMVDMRLGSSCRISTHKDILQEKENQKQLHELVLAKFIVKPRGLNFQFK